MFMLITWLICSGSNHSMSKTKKFNALLFSNLIYKVRFVLTNLFGTIWFFSIYFIKLIIYSNYLFFIKKV